jgi:hypothetical protein
MSREIIYRVTSHTFTMMRNGFGWIQLGTNDKAAGYIYLTTAAQQQKDRFGSADTDYPYMVTHLPFQMWDILLGILKNKDNLFIRGYEDDNGEVTVFFYTSDNAKGELMLNKDFSLLQAD